MPVKKLSDLPQKISSDNGDGFVITSVTGQDMRVPFQNLRTNLGIQSLEDKDISLQADIDDLEANQLASTIGFETKALMDADLAHDAGTVAQVMNDATASNNGYYRKDGASGTGSWVKRASFYAETLDPTDTSEAVVGKAIDDYEAESFGLLTRNGLRSYDSNTVVSTNPVSGTGTLSVKNIRQSLNLSISGDDGSILFFNDYRHRFKNPFTFKVDINVKSLGIRDPAVGVGIGNGTESEVLLIRESGQIFTYNENGSIKTIQASNTALEFTTGDTISFEIKSNYNLDIFYVTITRNGISTTQLIEIDNADRVIYGVRSGGCEFEFKPFEFIESAKSLTKKPFIYPSGFSFSAFKWDLYYDGDLTYSSGLDVNKYAPAGDLYYVDIATGLDTNAGTELAPFKTINHALGLTGDKVIYVKPGVYEGSNGFWDNGISDNLSILRWGSSGVIDSIANFTGLSWTDEGSNVYSATLPSTSLYHVFDRFSNESFGDYKRYSEQASQLDVQNNAGSFYRDGTTLYVRTFDNRAADSDILAMRSDIKSNFTDIDGRLYCEHVNFYGGAESFEVVGNNLTSGRDQETYFNTCNFKYAANNGLDVDGGGFYLSVNCQASSNELDGFNYHDQANSGTSAVNPPRFYEEDCKGIWNGYSGTDINNGSTVHDKGGGIRINGLYHNNQGRNIHDINDCLSLNLGCKSFESRASAGDANADFGCGIGTDDSKLFLINCYSADSDLNLYNHVGTIIEVSGLRTDSEIINNGVLARKSATQSGIIKQIK